LDDPESLVGPPACQGQPYETGAGARTRLTAVAVTTLGAPLADRARRDVAWPALIAALRRAENAGFDPVDALTRTATTRELHTARSVSELLARRINRHVAAHTAGTLPDAAERGGTATNNSFAADATRAEALLPWVPGPRLVPQQADEATPLTGYINDAAAVITARAAELADTVIRYRPPWMHLLGEQPPDADRAREWRRHVKVIAAYRDQHKITTDDPRQVLGPYAEPGHAGHKAYWHAAESVLAARRLSGLDPVGGAGDQASAQVAADIYPALPQAEREAIATVIAETPGTAWLGHPDKPDEHAATRPGYAGALSATLAGRGHTHVLTVPVHAATEDSAEPAEAAFARRRQPPAPRPVPRRAHEPERDQCLLPAHGAPAPVRAPQHRR
jgi:hypothetical protein